MKRIVPDPLVVPVDGRDHFVCPIEGCLDEAAKAGYLTHRSYVKHFETFHLQSETVGFISRIDWGSPGFRQGLLNLAFKRLEQEKVRFIILAGGLVSFPYLRKDLTISALRTLALEMDLTTTGGKGKKTPDIGEARDWLLDQWATEIAKALPRIRTKREDTKIYIVTSTASNYDGWVGTEVARRLVAKRSDIRFWGEHSARFPLKNQSKSLGVLVPKKTSWRSKYFSTSVDRLIEDEEKSTSQGLPDLWIVGCTASALQRSSGDKKRPYISVPAIHRLMEVNTAENQIGIRVVEFLPHGDWFLVRNHNFKDDVSNETRWIPNPETDDDLQKQIVTALKENDKLTIGMLEDSLKVGRNRIRETIEAINAAGFEPRIILDNDSHLYIFDPEWIQNKLSYPEVNLKDLREESMIGFGCLHSGSIFTEYHWFVEETPKIILEQGATSMIAAGDLIEGLEHDLDKRGEVMAGLNYTQQENLAAHMIGSVILKVFEVRLDEALQGYKKRKPSADELEAAVNKALLNFYFIPGNHCSWVLRKGVTPLASFEPAIINYLSRGVGDILAKRELELRALNRVIEQKVARGGENVLPSGLTLSVKHPSMARALTSSLRAQHTLEATDAQIVVSANFHVAIAVEQWGADKGQRVAMQCGALVWKTKFEESKLKRPDVGIGYLRALINQEGRILVTESTFFGGGSRKEYGNDFLLDRFMADIGI